MHQSLSSAVHSRLSLRGIIGARTLSLSLGLLASGTALADQSLPALGGGGGNRFEAHCPAGQVLTGFDLRAGDDIDAIRPRCASASGPRELGLSAAETTWYGGKGGQPAAVSCNAYSPVMNGMYVAFEGAKTLVVNNIHVFCGEATNTEPPNDAATALFDAPGVRQGGLLQSFAMAGNQAQRCPKGQVAVGVHGRAGSWLDAIGLICGSSGVAIAPPPGPPPSSVKSIGRRSVVNATTDRTAVCEHARQARARNSPQAARLEVQCKAANDAAPPTALPRPTHDALPATRGATQLNPQPLPPDPDTLQKQSKELTPVMPDPAETSIIIVGGKPVSTPVLKTPPLKTP